MSISMQGQLRNFIPKSYLANDKELTELQHKINAT